MITLASNSATQEELAAVLEAHGISPETSEVASTLPAKPSDPAPPASPGESPSGPEGEKTAPATTETGEEPQQPQAAAPKTDEPKLEGKFEPRRKQLEKQVARLHEDLDLERGSKAALQAKLDAAQVELAKLRPAEPEPAKPAEPAVRKMPKRADFDFDDEKYEAAMEEYVQGRDKDNAEATERTINERLAARDKETAERAAFDEYAKRRDSDAETVEDYKDLVAAVDASGDYPIPDMVKLKIFKSKAPARLIAFFHRDHLNDEGAELARIAALEPIDQVSEMTRIELELAGAKKKTPAAVKVETPVAPPVVAEPEPAKPVPVAAKPIIKPEDAPLEPLGGRTTGRTPELADAKNIKEYLALRAQNISR